MSITLSKETVEKEIHNIVDAYQSDHFKSTDVQFQITDSFVTFKILGYTSKPESMESLCTASIGTDDTNIAERDALALNVTMSLDTIDDILTMKEGSDEIIKLEQTITIAEGLIDALDRDEQTIDTLVEKCAQYACEQDTTSPSALDTTTPISEIAYRKYKQHWFAEQNHSTEFIDEIAKEWLAQQNEFPEENPSLCDFIEEHGFQGTLWVCYDEFLQCEYRDKQFMFNLLSFSEYLRYCQDLTIIQYYGAC